MENGVERGTGGFKRGEDGGNVRISGNPRSRGTAGGCGEGE